ncbi:relaxase/mobilization nuclease domain-containing protein [Pseudaminobacter sp. NGMCC 1.201702]|uniref:relaxase/mobilization nuclease domain-containing protein n=1 Tax=Pseudaminobacter sp. NGMCC 1.201702 TaxID=3391825 RepID=UPI0039F0C5CA
MLGGGALAEQRAGWEHLFDNRSASRDLGVFHVSVEAASPRSDVDQDDWLREILRSGFGDRRFVYTVQERSSDELNVSGVLVLRDRIGERLTGDWRAAEIVQRRYDDLDYDRKVEARFRFHRYGNGVEWGTARVKELIAGTNAEVRDETGRVIESAKQAGDLVQKEWRKELHSRKGRDVMHLIVSARAGTAASAFEGAVREFLGEQFAGHRYVFAVHDPALDPKEMAEGGRRPHIHAHAIVTMRSDTGERIVTSPQLFRNWRALMAEKARGQGIDMELTDRREFASAPAYTRNQVRPVSYHGRTEHEGTSTAARNRYHAKRSNEMSLATSDRSRQYASTAAQVWHDLANEEPGTRESAFAMFHKARIEGASEINQTDLVFAAIDQDSVKNCANMIELAQLVQDEDGEMQAMTRPEFEAYEKRVEAVLASVEQTLDPSGRAEFDEIAAAAREVVHIRREYVEFTERQANVGTGQKWPSRQVRREDLNAQREVAAARLGLQAVETANELRVEVSGYREGLDRAAQMAVDNQHVGEVPKSDRKSQRKIEQMERSPAVDRRDDSAARTYRESDLTGSGTSSQNEVASGGMQAAYASEQYREVVRSIANQDNLAEQQATMAPGRRGKHGDRVIGGKSALGTELVRSGSPQQRIAEGQNRDRDDRER